MNDSIETEEMKIFPIYPYLLQGQQALPKQISVGCPGEVRYKTPLPHTRHLCLTQPPKRFNASKTDLTLVLLNPDMPIVAHSVDPDQLATDEANKSGSALFVIKYVNS